MGILDKMANSLANGINKAASLTSNATGKGAQLAFRGNRYYPDADLEFRGYTDAGHVHIGLYPTMVRVGVRNPLTRAFGESNGQAGSAAVAMLGKGDRNVGMRYIGDIETTPDGAMTKLNIHVVGARSIRFSVFPQEAESIVQYILAYR